MARNEQTPGAPVGPDATEPQPTYDPRKLIEMATVTDIYLATLPPIVMEMAVMSVDDIDALFSGEVDFYSHIAMQRMQKTAGQLIEEGQNRLKTHLLDSFFDYDPEISRLNFGFNRGLPLEKKLQLLPPGHQQKWDEHLISGELSREKVPYVLRAVTGIYANPYEMPTLLEERITNPRVAEVHSRMERVPHQIALQVLPDLTDTEAERIFYPDITAQKVRDIAAGIAPVE